MRKKLAHVLAGALIGVLLPWLCLGFLIATVPHEGPNDGLHIGHGVLTVLISIPNAVIGATVSGYIAMRRYGRPPKYEFPPRRSTDG